ncbi:MAG: cupin domain-containing protein [Anaerolineales bacterium]
MTAPYTFHESLIGQLPNIPQDSILSQTIQDSPDAKTTLFGFAPGQELTEHTASQPAVLYFLEGEGSLWLDGKQVHVQAGSFVHMSARLPHSVRAESPLTFLLILIKGEAGGS